MRSNSNPPKDNAAAGAGAGPSATPAAQAQFKYCPYDGYKYGNDDSACFICNRPRGLVQAETTPSPVTTQFAMQNVLQEESQREWKKILFDEKEDHEDNAVEPDFLSCLVEESPDQQMSYADLVHSTKEITFAIDLIVLFMVLYYLLVTQKVPLLALVTVEVLTAIIGTFLYIFLCHRLISVHEIFLNAIRILGVVLAVALLSPYYRAMNSSYADDSIYAIVTISIVFHLIFKDYTFQYSDPQTWRVNFSTLLSIFFCSLLCSRMPDNVSVAVLLSSSLVFFIFSHFLNRAIKEYSRSLYSYAHLTLSLVNAIILYQINRVVAFIYFSIYVLITFLCPLWLVWLYQYKNTISGPWDLPKVKVH